MKERNDALIGEPQAVLLNNHDLSRDCHYIKLLLGASEFLS